MAAPNRKCPHHSLEKRYEALAMLKGGATQMEVASATGIPQSTLSRMNKKYCEHQTLADLPHTGAPRKLEGKLLHFIAVSTLLGHFESARAIRRYIIRETGDAISITTVLAALRREGVEPKRVFWAKRLTAKQRKARLAFAEKMKANMANGSIDFKRVVFTDETALHKQEKGRRKYKYVRSGTSAAALAPKPELNLGGGKVNLWAAIGPEGILAWRIYRTNLNGALYKDILETELLPAAKRFFKQKTWHFQQDNAKPHTSKLVKAWLKKSSKANRFAILEWPVNSGDLSPIENLWLELKDYLSNQGDAKTMSDLHARVEAAIQHFNTSRKELFKNYYASMGKRLDAVIKHRGDSTGY